MQRPLSSGAGPLILALTLFALSAGMAGAQPAKKAPAKPADATPQTLGAGKIWAAYSFGPKDAKVCYLVGKPAKSEPASAKRGRVDALVTHRPAEHAVNVVNFDLGYTAKPDAKAELEIDGKKFSLFIDKEAAWTNDAAADKAVTEALAKGKRATIKGMSAHGTATTDTYSLEGLAAALALIDKACNVKR
jgi:hypothetical protein